MSINTKDYATSVVPQSERRSVWNLTAVWSATCITVSGLIVGAALVQGLELWDAIFAIVIGNIVLTIIGGLVGTIGAEQGVGSAMLARHAFGRQGAKIIAICVAIVMLGWFSVQIDLFGKTLNAMFPDGGFLFNPKVSAIWGGVLMTATAYIGYRGLALLSIVAVPVLTVLAVVGLIVALGDSGWTIILEFEPAQQMALTIGTGIVIGSVVAGASVQADIMRYAKNSRAVWISTALGFMTANIFMLFAGYAISVVTGSWDLPKAMVGLGLGVPALLVLVLAQWTTNDSNLYWSSLSFANIFNIKKPVLVLLCGSLGILAGLLGIANNFIGFLLILGVTIPPIAGILITDYFFVSKEKYKFGKNTKYSQWELSAIISWVLASYVAYRVQWGISAINALILSGVIYYVFAKVVNNTLPVGEYIEDENGF